MTLPEQQRAESEQEGAEREQREWRGSMKGASGRNEHLAGE
jgi:hypothetical protein